MQQQTFTKKERLTAAFMYIAYPFTMAGQVEDRVTGLDADDELQVLEDFSKSQNGKSFIQFHRNRAKWTTYVFFAAFLIFFVGLILEENAEWHIFGIAALIIFCIWFLLVVYGMIQAIRGKKN